MKYMSIVLGTLCVVLSACATREPEPSPSDLYGPMTVTGTVVSTGSSLYRRGSHVLLQEGHSRFFLESHVVDLQELDGVETVLQGDIEPNTHPSFLPVMIVMSVKVLTTPLQEELQPFVIPALGLRLSAPRGWISLLTGERLIFRQSDEAPFLTIEGSMSALPSDGIALRVAGSTGVRIIEEGSGRHLVYVSRESGSTILFAFQPDPEDPTLRDAFYALLRTVEFLEEETSSSSSSASSDDTPFIPCGGPAHVLCPEGMYCEVRELDTGIGACRRLS